MVKLIRLASDNDCKFSADLDQGIKLKENSQIALQNLTFDTEDFLAIEVGGNRDRVEYSLNRAGLAPAIDDLPFHHATLKNATYTAANINDLYADVESKLNMCCKTDGTANSNAYHSFDLVYDDKPGYEGVSIEGVYIIQKLNPMSMMFNFNHDGKLREDTRSLFEFSENPVNANDPSFSLVSVFTGSNGLDLGNLTMYPTLSARATHDIYILPSSNDIYFSRGSGMYMARIHNLDTNGGTADTNGFAIGLSFTDIRKETNGGTTPMTNVMRDFELRVKRPTDAFEFVNPTIPNTNQISVGNTPFKFNSTADPDQLTHDLILFEKDAQIITCKIINTSVAGGSATTIFTYTMTDAEHEKVLYPYIIAYGASSTTEIGLPVLTVDNNINPLNLQNVPADGVTVDNDLYGIVGQEQELKTLGDINIYQVYATNHGNGFPNSGLAFNDEIFQNTDTDSLGLYKAELKIHTRILQNMGYDINGNRLFTFAGDATLMSSNAGYALGQFSLEPDGSIDISSSDNYIVVLDSQQLKSFDASEYDYSANPNAINQNNNTTKRGRQKSILATIPSNNSTGIVEYQPNELTYIDLDNRFDMELKNLRLRVLNKQFGEIRTNGTSIMTLLLKD